MDYDFSGTWFQTEIKKLRYTDRINRVMGIDEYLRREHKVLQLPSFEFKEHTFEPTKLILQTLKSIIKFHSSYIVGTPVSITGWLPEDRPGIGKRSNNIWRYF